MTYDKLLEQGRKMTARQVAAGLQGLILDPRFAAVVAVIDKLKTETADAACDQNYADRKGTLEHAAGVRFGLILLEAKIRAQTDPAPRTGERKA